MFQDPALHIRPTTAAPPPIAKRTITFARYIALALLTLLAAACAPDAPSTSTYAKDGVSFVHLADWKVTEDESVPGNPDFRIISIEGPNDAIVMLSMRPSPAGKSLEQYAAAISRKHRAATEKSFIVGSVRPANASAAASQVVVGRVGGSDQVGISHRFNVNHLGQQVAHEARFFQLSGNNITVFVATQVAADGATAAAPAMALTLDSLRIIAPI